MKNTIRLVIALGFAGFAAFLNFIWVQSHLPKYGEYTIYVEDLSQGTVLESKHLREISLPERTDYEHSGIFIPWEEYSTLIGVPTPRDIKTGELALRSDVRYDDKHTILKSFRLAEPFLPDDKKITLAVSYKRKNPRVTGAPESFEPAVEQLLGIIDQDRNNNRASIQSITLLADPQAGDDYGGEIKLPIDLSDKIARPSSRIEKGSLIGFVVPASLIPLTLE